MLIAGINIRSYNQDYFLALFLKDIVTFKSLFCLEIRDTAFDNDTVILS